MEKKNRQIRGHSFESEETPTEVSIFLDRGTGKLLRSSVQLSRGKIHLKKDVLRHISGFFHQEGGDENEKKKAHERQGASSVKHELGKKPPRGEVPHLAEKTIMTEKS